jgi:hypothetical protein
MNEKDLKGFTADFGQEFVIPQIKFWFTNVFDIPEDLTGIEREYYNGLLEEVNGIKNAFSPPYREHPGFFFHEVVLTVEQVDVLKGIIGDSYIFLQKKLEQKKNIGSKYLKADKEEQEIKKMEDVLNSWWPNWKDSINQRLFVPFDQLPKNGTIENASQIALYKYDVFICHASEDKEFVSVLAEALKNAGIKVWYDDFILSWGNNLRQTIDGGLKSSEYVVVVFSKAFFRKKKWTEHELNGLFAQEREGVRDIILPIWYDITREEILEYSPALADKLAKRTDQDSISEMVESLKMKLGK